MFERVHDELADDAWLIGRITGQEFTKGKPYPVARKETFPREPWFARRDAKAYGVVLDAHGKIAWGRSDWLRTKKAPGVGKAHRGFRLPAYIRQAHRG